eukprot:g13307.t1
MRDRPAVGEAVDTTLGGAAKWDKSCKGGPDVLTASSNRGGGGNSTSDLESFRYGELALVERLLPLIESRVTSGHHASEFRGSLLRLLDICSRAPVRDRANQEFTEPGLAASSSLFRTLGALLWSPDAGIQSATADALRKIAAGNDPTRPNTPDDEKNLRFGECRDDLRPKPKDINQALLLGCGVVTSAVACLGKVMGDVMESLNALDDSSSLGSSSFGDAELEPLDVGGELVETEEAEPAAPGEEPAPRDGDLGETEEGVDFDDAEDADSTVTKAHEDGVGIGDTAVGDSGGGGGDGERSSVNLGVLRSLLELVRELSIDARSSAAMVEEGLVALLVQAMRAVRGIRDPTLSITVEVMWNCLEHSQNAMDYDHPADCRTSLIRKARKSNAAFALSSWSGVSALKDIVEALLIGGFRNKDKELRNEAVIVASQLSSNGRSHSLFRKTGMLLLLLRYATAVETGLADGSPLGAESEARTLSIAGTEGSRSGCNGDGDGLERTGVPELGPLADPRNFATIKEVDMELKLLLWSLLTDLCKRDARNVEVVNASPLMETLLMYVDLVVEEGPGGDAQPPGMGRSISLASMPTFGNRQQTNSSAVIGPTTPTLSPEAGGRSSTRHPGSTGSELGLETSPCAAPFSGNTPASIDAPASSASDQGLKGPGNLGGLETSCEDRVADDHEADLGSKRPAKKSSVTSTGDEVKGSQEIGCVTQLFVPASVFRLPVTSIQLLQSQAMASLLVLAPKCPRKFQALGGHMVTLRLLDRLGNRPDNQRLVKVATKMLAVVVSLPGLKEELGRVDGVKIMLDRFSNEWKSEQHGSGTRGSSAGGGGGGGGGVGGVGEGASEVRTDMVIILCRLCEDCPENQEAFRKANGVPIMMSAVKSYCRARSEAKQQEGDVSGRGGAGGGAGASGGASLGLLDCSGEVEAGGSGGESLDPALVHIIDCVWCAVVGNRRSEARLLQCEGLDTLLDLLELCPVFMRHQVTGVVADLLRNKRSIPYARAWRSDLNMLSVTQLMVRLWVSEESRLGISRPNGVLQNLWEPLQSHDRARSRRSLTKPPGRGVRSRPNSRDGAGTGPTQSTTTSGGFDSTKVGTGSSRTITTLAVDADVAAQNTASAGLLDGACTPALSLSEAGEGLGSRGDDGGAGAANETNGGSCSAVAFALEAGRRAVAVGQGGGGGGQRRRASQMGVEESVAKSMMSLDLRGKIAAVLGMVGFDGSTTEGLGPTDLKASYMATSYMDFRAGEAWRAVAGELEAQQTNPIAADALVLDTMLERAFDCAQQVKSKQIALTLKQGEKDAEKEEAFFAGILFQRDQEIRQAIIKRNALMPGTSKKRLAAKKAKADMLKRSSDRSQAGSSDMEAGSDRGPPGDGADGKETGAVLQDAKGKRPSAITAAAG